KEVMELFEACMTNGVIESLRVDPVGVTSKTKCFKKPPRRSIKRKKFKWKIKKEKLKSDPEDRCSWLVGREVAPLKRVNKRSWVESKMKYP
ncbi:hypothetical protein A2U01_0080597, partial [Trifolium medium]|nr:hypothetical protein [Trifolium medium]